MSLFHKPVARLGVVFSLFVIALLAAAYVSAKSQNSVQAPSPATACPDELSFKFPNHPVSLGVPDDLKSQLDDALKYLGGKSIKATDFFDFDPKTSDLITYHFSSDNDGSVTLTGTVPIKDSQKATFGHVDFTTSDGNQDVQVLGGLYAPSLNLTPLLMVYLVKNDQIRLYDANGKTTDSAKIVRRTFNGVFDDKSGKRQPSDGDKGTIISAQEMCFTVGLAQICVELPTQDKTAQDPAQQAVNDFMGKYSDDLKDSNFAVNWAVYDLLGDGQRRDCAAELAKYDFKGEALPNNSKCTPTAVIVALAGAPKAVSNFRGTTFAVLVILDNTNTGTGLQVDTQDYSATDIQNNQAGELYDGKTGSRVSLLPPGEYLLFSPVVNLSNATPESTPLPSECTPSADPTGKVCLGDVRAILLKKYPGKDDKNPDGDTYCIPGKRVEAFGAASDSPKATPTPQAWVKDGGGDGWWYP